MSGFYWPGPLPKDGKVHQMMTADEMMEKIAADRALLHRAAEMLRKHEWQDVFIDNGGYGDHWELQCPSCHGTQKDGHADNCALAALIRELESRLAL